MPARAGRLPPLDEVRDAVERDLRYQRDKDAARRFYEDVVSRYRVTIDWPKPEGDGEAEERDQ